MKEIRTLIAEVCSSDCKDAIRCVYGSVAAAADEAVTTVVATVHPVPTNDLATNLVIDREQTTLVEVCNVLHWLCCYYVFLL